MMHCQLSSSAYVSEAGTHTRLGDFSTAVYAVSIFNSMVSGVTGFPSGDTKSNAE